MILTNQLNLHPIILQACEKNIQKPTVDAIRCTELLNPPLIKNLMLKFWDSLQQDVSELAWSIFGTATHSLFEKLHRPGMLQGFGMEATLLDQKIRGTLDLLDFKTKEILDFKSTSVWKIVYGDYEHFIQQLNIYKWLAAQYGIKIDKLTNILLLKDWRSRDAKASTGNYPKSPIVSYNAPVWPLEQTQKFIEERVKVYKTQPWTVCTTEERWEKITYAVMQKGKKRALTNGVKNTIAEAQAFLTSQRLPDLTIEKRGGTPLRCLEYCPVKDYCPFGKTLKNNVDN